MLSDLLIENSDISEICPPRSGGWRVSRRRGRVLSYLAAYMLGLVLGLVCHIGNSSVAGTRLRSSHMLVVLVVLDFLVPCTNHISDLGLCNQGPAYGLTPSPDFQISD